MEASLHAEMYTRTSEPYMNFADIKGGIYDSASLWPDPTDRPDPASQQ